MKIINNNKHDPQNPMFCGIVYSIEGTQNLLRRTHKPAVTFHNSQTKHY